MACVGNVCTDKMYLPLFRNVGCKVHPNIITILNLLLVVPLVLGCMIKAPNTILGWSFYIILILFNRFLDNLDGTVARKCNKVSKFGAALDLFGDFILAFGACIVVLFYVYKYGKQLNPILNISVSLVAIVVPLTMFITDIKFAVKKKKNKIEEFVDNNSTLFFGMYLILLKCYINYIKQ